VVSDTLPPDGQISTPAERIIHIISHADYNAMVMEQVDQHALEQKYSELLTRIAELEQQMAEATKQSPSPERSAKLDALAARAGELTAQVAAMRRPEPLFAIEPQLQDELEKHLQALAQHAQQMKDQPASESTPQAAERLRQELEAMTAQAEADALRDHLRDLAAAQRQTANELADLKKQGIRNDADRARLREASRQQQEMEQALKEWQEAAKDVAKRLQKTKPDEASEVTKLCEQVGACEAGRLAGQAGRAGRGGRVGEAQRDAEEAARRLEALAGAGQGEGQGQGKGGQPGWCPGDGYGRCLSQLQGLAKRGFNQSSSMSSSGGGATGARGGGLQVRRGGRSSPSGEQLQLFGPESLSALAGATSGQQKNGAPANAAGASAAEARAATAYATGTRATTAGVGATFSPGEQVLIEDYFRRLDGDPSAPVVPTRPSTPLPAATPTSPVEQSGNTPP
jgi:chemotaxis protein histidine kinase CheA